MTKFISIFGRKSTFIRLDSIKLAVVEDKYQVVLLLDDGGREKCTLTEWYGAMDGPSFAAQPGTKILETIESGPDVIQTECLGFIMRDGCPLPVAVEGTMENFAGILFPDGHIEVPFEGFYDTMAEFIDDRKRRMKSPTEDSA